MAAGHSVLIGRQAGRQARAHHSTAHQQR
jgi:hypothetical protein